MIVPNLLKTVHCSISRFAAIFVPLKYHIHASCSTGKIICLLTLLLTIVLTIISINFINIIYNLPTVCFQVIYLG